MRLLPSITILRAQSDDRLVALAREGSHSAFAAIVERYRRTLQRACRRVLSESRAEDAVQQAFMAAWVALQRGDEVRDLRAWLLMIARNTSLNALRVPGYDYTELHESLVANEAPQEELERREVMRQTLAGLAALPDRQREVLLRSAVEGVAYADIARDLGLTEGAARQLVLRARTTMRSAATAFMPMPIVHWIATSSRTGTTLRIAEIVTAGGGAGVTALLAKTAVVAVVAGSVVAAPVVVQRGGELTPAPGVAGAQASPSKWAPAATSVPQSVVAASVPAKRASDTTHRSDDADQGGPHSGRDEDDRDRGRGHRPSRRDDSGSDDHDDRRGSSGGAGPDDDEPSSSGSGGDGRSGSRSDDDHPGETGSGSETGGSASERDGNSTQANVAQQPATTSQDYDEGPVIDAGGGSGLAGDGSLPSIPQFPGTDE